ncbi:hypothetical protein [Streptomyces laculatispora]|uniref:hypothetical protein n=1 Tax=Streptomyces laculatispora TaxID=887464 RepID=UPI001A94A8C5|nr:hypothetical protein [Streptomyces laculatispora]MBO0913140.1 hypothetical protein [Streptomyces laculatispora]
MAQGETVEGLGERRLVDIRTGDGQPGAAGGEFTQHDPFLVVILQPVEVVREAPKGDHEPRLTGCEVVHDHGATGRHRLRGRLARPVDFTGGAQAPGQVAEQPGVQGQAFRVEPGQHHAGALPCLVARLDRFVEPGERAQHAGQLDQRPRVQQFHGESPPRGQLPYQGDTSPVDIGGLRRPSGPLQHACVCAQRLGPAARRAADRTRRDAPVRIRMFTGDHQRLVESADPRKREGERHPAVDGRRPERAGLGNGQGLLHRGERLRVPPRLTQQFATQREGSGQPAPVAADGTPAGGRGTEQGDRFPAPLQSTRQRLRRDEQRTGRRAAPECGPE